MQKQFLMAGDINIDNILPMPDLPALGRDALAYEMEIRLGGTSANSAVVLGKLGAPVGVISCLGTDHWGDEALKELISVGVDVQKIVRKGAARTGIIFVIVTPDGERTMFCYRGANVLITPQDIPEDCFAGQGILLLSGYAFLAPPQSETARELVRRARLAGWQVALDSGLEPVLRYPDMYRDLLAEVDICISGLEECTAMFGIHDPLEAVDRLLAAGPTVVALKLGSRGCILARGAERLRLPAFKFETKADTTGAGDVFSGAFLYGLQNDLSLAGCGTLATALAGLATTVPGGGIGLPGWQELRDFLSSSLGQAQAGLFGTGVEEVSALFMNLFPGEN